MKIAAVSCANGLGHLKRSIRILNAVVDRFSPAAITLFCDRSGVEQIVRWNEYIVLQERCALNTVPVTLPGRWKETLELNRVWLSDWHTSMRDWNLPAFDFVISDNFVEPLLYSDRVALIGSFFWHDVLFSAFGESEFERYAKWCEDLLTSYKPHVIANRYFAMPEVRRQPNVHTIGLIPFSTPRRTEPLSRSARRILIALGSAQTVDNVADQLRRAIEKFQGAGLDVLASATVRKRFAPHCGNIQSFDFGRDDFDSIDFAIIRGGLGSISDCIAARIPMLYVNDFNPELKFNQARLTELGIGLPLDLVLEQGADFLNNPSMHDEMVSKMNSFDLEGHLAGSSILANLSEQWAQPWPKS